MAVKPSQEWCDRIHGLEELHAEAVAKGDQEPPFLDHVSIRQDHLLCLECGKAYRSIRRHLGDAHHLTPDTYRSNWRLPANYPMEAPAYITSDAELYKTQLDGMRTLFPKPFIARVDEILDDYLVALQALEATPGSYPVAFDAIRKAVLRLNQAAELGEIETSVREQFCDFFRTSIVEQGFDLAVFCRSRALQYNDVTQEWRDW